MKNLFNCRSLIKVAIITMVVALMASQMTDAYAKKNKKKEKIHSTLVEINNKLDQFLSGPAPVEKTGQTTSFATWDDGDLVKGVTWPNPRFTDNGDGTITDNLTGLIWDQNANRFGTRTWAEALSDCNSLAAIDHGDLVDGSVAGDWRLPNVRELSSLIHYGFARPALPNTTGTVKWSDGDPFTNMPELPWAYWSSTSDAFTITPPAMPKAWNVSFLSGSMARTGKDVFNHVWCVRGP